MLVDDNVGNFHHHHQTLTLLVGRLPALEEDIVAADRSVKVHHHHLHVRHVHVVHVVSMIVIMIVVHIHVHVVVVDRSDVCFRCLANLKTQRQHRLCE